MADSVQYIMDRMSSHFRQLEELELFTKDEVRSVVKKRTDFEYVMKRRQLTADDFYVYLQYEINLDKLRVLRCEKLEALAGSKDKQDALRNVKSFCSRHICSVFDRAVRRFPNNMELWMDYIAYLKEAKSNSILNTVFGKALALHPKNDDFWMQAAVHELEMNNNVQAARTLFQRALRVNKHSRKLWLRYFELELWNVSRTSERSRILGLDDTSESLQQGAPTVVFKHALMTNPEVDLACDMHLSAAGVDSGLASQFESQMREKFGTKSALWAYLIRRMATDTALGDGLKSETAGATADAASSSSKKRKQRVTDGASEVKVVEALTSLEKVLVVLAEGKTAVTAGKVASELADFRVIELKILCESLESLFPAIQGLLVGGESAEGADASEGHEQESGSKKKKKDNTPKTAIISPSEHGASVLSERALASLESVAVRLGVYCSGGTAALDKLLGGAEVSAVPELVSYCCAKYHLYRVATLLPAPAATSALMEQVGGAFGCRELAERLHVVAQRLVRSKALHSSVGSSAWEQGLHAAKVWSLAISLCAKDALKLGKQSDAVRSVVEAGIAGLSLAACCQEGCAALDGTLVALELMFGAGSKHVRDRYWKAIIACTHLQPQGRGDWCARYLRLAASRACASSTDGSSALRAAYEWVESVLKVCTPAVLGGDLAEFHAAAVELLSEALFSRGVKNAPAELVAFVRQVAGRATEVCPSEQRFWDTWEELERRLGDHEKANHILWKKSRAST